MKLSEPLALLEIRLQETTYTLETDLTGRQEFSSADDFLSAFSQHSQWGAMDEHMIDPVRLGLRASSGLQNFSILTPGKTDPSALQTILPHIASKNGLLVLAVPNSFTWTEEYFLAIAMAIQNAVAVWPVYLGEDVSNHQELSFLLGQMPIPVLKASHLNAELDAFLPGFLVSGLNHPLRQAVTLSAYARRCRSLLDMIQERFEADQRQLESRQKREARLERTIGAEAKDQDGRVTFDRLKSQFSEELARLLQALRENSRRSLLKSGELGQVLDQLLTSLQPDDLERELAHKVVKLSLKPEVLTGFRRRLAKALRQQVDEDCVLIRDSLDLLRQNVERTLAEVGATSRSLALSTPDNRQLWESLGEALQLDIRYKGELPRRGFWQRMAEGRRIVFVAMMLMSLVGGFAGFNVRQIGAFGFVFLILFLGGVIYTYTSWNKEENEQLDKEVDKVKESMQTEFNRTLNDILRDKQTRLQQIIDDLKRDGLAQLDNAQKEAQRNQALTNQNELRDAKAKLRVIDQRLKELRPLAQQINTLARAIEDFGRDAGQWLRELAQQESGA